MKLYTDVYESALGPITLKATDDVLWSLDFDSDPHQTKISPNLLLGEVRKQLGEYFDGKRKRFDLPFEIQGTPFQKKVLQAMLSIPYGEVLSYSELASQIQHPIAFRAVGNACNRNQIPVIIPCHRIVALNGIGGFGCGLEKKRFLLKLEGSKL